MKFNFKQLLKPGSILIAASTILAFVAWIVYFVNVASKGYFIGNVIPAVVTLGIFSIIFGLVILFLNVIEVEGIWKEVKNISRSVLLILFTCFLVWAMLAFISGRAEGLAYIFGAQNGAGVEIQTPENLASAKTAIAGFIIFGIAWVIGLVGSFFSVEQKAKKVEAVEQK